jgi:hypothetical protein
VTDTRQPECEYRSHQQESSEDYFDHDLIGFQRGIN